MKIFLLEVISQSKKRNRNRKIINEIQNKNMRELRKRGGGLVVGTEGVLFHASLQTSKTCRLRQ